MMRPAVFLSELDELLHRIAVDLQLTPTQHKTADLRYGAIGQWLEGPGSPLQGAHPTIYPQGSLRIGTTVKPLARQEYDLDLVCELQLDWRLLTNPVDLLNAVEERLRQHGQYRQMIERKNRCVRINYAGDFHLDILPACPDPSSGPGCVVVPDRRAQGWRPSNPQGYAEWFENRAKLFQTLLTERMAPLPGWQPENMKPPLKIAVQLLKRWRDIAYARVAEHAPSSIILTTLAGLHYDGAQSVSVVLSVVLDRIVGFIETSGPRLMLPNPTNQQEDLSECWNDPRSYCLFCDGIRAFHGTWRTLQQRRGIPEVALLLESLFGKDLTIRALKEQAESVEELRSLGKLASAKGSGKLGIATSSTPSVAVRPNTFFGA